MAKKTEKIDHSLVPEHTKLSDKEKETTLKEFNIKINQLPIILATDPSIQHLGVVAGDVIKIKRKSPTSGTAIFYRGVANG